MGVHIDRCITCTCSGLQLAKQLDSREDIIWVIVKEVVDSALASCLHRSCERDSKQTIEFLGLLIT